MLEGKYPEVRSAGLLTMPELFACLETFDWAAPYYRQDDPNIYDFYDHCLKRQSKLDYFAFHKYITKMSAWLRRFPHPIDLDYESAHSEPHDEARTEDENDPTMHLLDVEEDPIGAARAGELDDAE